MLWPKVSAELPPVKTSKRTHTIQTPRKRSPSLLRPMHQTSPPKEAPWSKTSFYLPENNPSKGHGKVRVRTRVKRIKKLDMT